MTNPIELRLPILQYPLNGKSESVVSGKKLIGLLSPSVESNYPSRHQSYMFGLLHRMGAVSNLDYIVIHSTSKQDNDVLLTVKAAQEFTERYKSCTGEGKKHKVALLAFFMKLTGIPIRSQRYRFLNLRPQQAASLPSLTLTPKEPSPVKAESSTVEVRPIEQHMLSKQEAIVELLRTVIEELVLVNRNLAELNDKWR